MPPKNKVCVSDTLDPVIARRVSAAAEKIGQSRSQFVESVLRGALADADGLSGVLANPKVMQVFYTAFSAPGVMDAFATAFQDKLTREQTQQMLGFMSSTGGKRSRSKRK